MKRKKAVVRIFIMIMVTLVLLGCGSTSRQISYARGDIYYFPNGYQLTVPGNMQGYAFTEFSGFELTQDVKRRALLTVHTKDDAQSTLDSMPEIEKQNMKTNISLENGRTATYTYFPQDTGSLVQIIIWSDSYPITIEITDPRVDKLVENNLPPEQLIEDVFKLIGFAPYVL